MTAIIDAIYSLDLSVVDALDRLHTPALNAFMRAVTHAGDGGLIWIVLAAALLIFRRTRGCGAALAFSLVFCLLLNNLVLKTLVDRARPFIRFAIEPLIDPPGGASFPSGHTASSFACAFALAFTLRRSQPFGAGAGMRTALLVSAGAFLLAGIIALSRVWLHVHYLTDVLAGAASGAVCAALGTVLAMAMVRRFACRGKTPPEKGL